MLYQLLCCRVFVIMLAVVQTSCSSFIQPRAVNDPDATWQTRQEKLANINNWKIAGRLAVTQGAEVWHMSVQWQQQDQNYKINLSGPFGMGAVLLSGDPNGVLIKSKDEQFYATDAEQLLLQQTGVKIPIDNLIYWIRGLPSPHAELTSHELDQYGRLSLLIQNNWSINFKRYTQSSHVELPSKIFIEKKGIDIRLVVEDWFLRL